MLGTKIERVGWDFPTTGVMGGNYVSLAPLSQDHLGDLWDRAHASPDSFTYLRYGPFEQVSEPPRRARQKGQRQLPLGCLPPG